MKIQALRSSLKTAELRLADYILNAPEKIEDHTIHELQEKSGSSYATIIRFCKKAGYRGFKEFKASLAQDVSQLSATDFSVTGLPIQENDSVETIIEKSFASSFKTLEDTRNIIDTESIRKAVDVFLNANEIFFIGTGASAVVAQYAFTRFYRIGKKCSAICDPTIYKTRIALLGKTDLVFAISSSGRSANVVDGARLAHENRCTVISLADFAVSPLTKISDINLYTTPRNTAQFLELDLPLIMGQIAIIDVLFFACCSQMGHRSVDLMNLTKSIADQEKIQK